MSIEVSLRNAPARVLCFSIVLLIVTVGAPAGASISRTEFQSNAPLDLITYSINEDNGPQSVCSVGNTQNVLVPGAEILNAGISAIKILPGGSCLFIMTLWDDQGTYHYYFRLRAESGDPPAPVGQAHLSIGADYDNQVTGQPWESLADANTLVTFPRKSSFSVVFGTNDNLWATVDWASRSGIAYRNFSGNGNMDYVFFTNSGPETVWLDAQYLSSAQ